MYEEPPEAAEALAMEIAIEPPPVVVVLEPTSSMPMQCHSGSPAQEPWRRCPRPCRSTERWPPCRRIPPRRCGIWPLAAGGLELRLADAGAVQALLEAMAQHGGVAAVQRNASAALRNLTAGSEALEQRLADAGAVEALQQAVAQHRAVAAAQENASSEPLGQ